ncbi:MAG TPA: DUF2393 domain-containing protein, partial [Campylobacteraceae bacterium]|nr:DUF2393 domain-containing protein [Campylobacteraceae bacterium]
MIHLTTLHWIAIAIFILLFFILSLLSLREKKIKNMLLMVFSSFLLTTAAAVITVVVLDKYTKKAKILTYATQRDLAHESIILRGLLQNIGKYKIGYCNLEVRISQNPRGSRANSYFKPTKSFDFMTNAGNKKYSVTEEREVAQNLMPGEKKKFFVSVRIPGHFEDPKYF